MLQLKRNSKLLFEGDSITDCGRDRADRNSLSGYNRIIAAKSGLYRVEAFNRAVSGNRSKDVLARLEDELAELRPDAFSLLIGVNDTWRRYDSNDPTSGMQFYDNLRGILSTVRARGAKIIVLEPFLLPTDPAKAVMREDLDLKIDITRSLAREFADEFVPLDGLFAELVLKIPPEQLSADGVHPTELGNEYIARWWLERVGFER